MLKSPVLWGIVGAVVVVVIAGVVWFRSTYVEVPDVTGMSYGDAVETIGDVSEDWQVSVLPDSSDGDESLALLRMHLSDTVTVSDLPVFGQSVEAGTLMNKSDTSQVIELTTRISDDEKAKLEDRREKGLGNNSLYLNAEAYEDNGVYIESRPQVWSSFPSTNYLDVTPKSFAKNCKSALRKIAIETGESLIVQAKTSDGFTVGIAVAYHPWATDAEKSVIRARANELKRKADSYAQSHAKKYCKKLVKQFRKWGFKGGSYNISAKSAIIYGESKWSSTIWTGNTRAVDSTRSGYKEIARLSAQMLRRNVTIKMVNKGYHGTWDKFKAKKPKWPKF